jgi:hypothetical protein
MRLWVFTRRYRMSGQRSVASRTSGLRRNVNPSIQTARTSWTNASLSTASGCSLREERDALALPLQRHDHKPTAAVADHHTFVLKMSHHALSASSSTPSMA